MKITNVYFKEGVWNVRFRPTRLERLFGFKEEVKEYKDTYETYTYGGGGVYISKGGRRLSPYSWIGQSIDIWKRKF